MRLLRHRNTLIRLLLGVLILVSELQFSFAGAGSRASAVLTPWIDTNLEELVQLYRHFHQHPELSFQEQQTAGRLSHEFAEAGAEVTTGIGGHGVVGLLKNGSGPTVMLRTDLDALPVTEQTGLTYASKATANGSDGTTVGVMHACGHDVHITNLVGSARFLAAHKNRWQGTVMLIGQPAEERGAGAQAMLADGLFSRFPKPNFALALHVDPQLAAGTIGYRTGYALANVDSVDITMLGRGGHGAYPHATIDPIVQAAQVVMALQTIVSREIKPIEPAVVTVGSIHGGTKHNVIGDKCHLEITVRSYSDKVRKHIHTAIRRKAKAVAIGADAPEPIVDILVGTPSLWNDEDLASRLLPALRILLGSEHITESEPSMGGEDFSRYGKVGVPILMMRLGSIRSDRLQRYKQLGQQPPSLHSARYYPDIAETLRTSVAVTATSVLELLPPTAAN